MLVVFICSSLDFILSFFNSYDDYNSYDDCYYSKFSGSCYDGCTLLAVCKTVILKDRVQFLATALFQTLKNNKMEVI